MPRPNEPALSCATSVRDDRTLGRERPFRERSGEGNFVAEAEQVTVHIADRDVGLDRHLAGDGSHGLASRNRSTAHPAQYGVVWCALVDSLQYL
jgi:hypothetical protein